MRLAVVAPAYVAACMEGGEEAQNSPPVLLAEPSAGAESVVSGGQTFAVSATDADGDDVFFSWALDGASIGDQRTVEGGVASSV